jgi:hypothetical protein
MVMTALAILAAVGNAFCQATPRDIDAFSKASLVYIATIRKDGNQSKAAPVWFTTTPDHVLIINTGPSSWKAKRIRRGSPALVWIGSPEKYLTARVGLFRPSQEKFDKGTVVAIKITPVRDLPEHFVSQPGTPAPSLEAAPAATAAPH